MGAMFGKKKKDDGEIIDNSAAVFSTHSIGHVHHRFGKVLRLSGRPTKLHKLTREEERRGGKAL